MNFTFYYVFIPSDTIVLHLTFFVSPILSIAFFAFLELYFFSFLLYIVFFEYLLWIYVYFLQMSCNVFKKLLILREIFTPQTGTFDF